MALRFQNWMILTEENKKLTLRKKRSDSGMSDLRHQRVMESSQWDREKTELHERNVTSSRKMVKLQ